MKKHTFPLIQFLTGASLLSACAQPMMMGNRLVPAQEFSKAVRDGKAGAFSIFDVDPNDERRAQFKPAVYQEGSEVTEAQSLLLPAANRLPAQGYALKQSIDLPSQQFVVDEKTLPLPSLPPGPPPGSSSPYLNGPMSANPSLWPDQGDGVFAMRDARAFQTMDVVTILVSESQEGRKKAETNTKGEFSLTAAIKSFFGFEKSWESNNDDLKSTSLVDASTDTEFKGKGETKRSGSLTGKLSAVILETLPNGLLRLEGSKIISVNNEEEIMVISGLVRARDIDAQNRVESSRIANMRIDFYGRGVVNDQQGPGWGARVFEAVWPF